MGPTRTPNLSIQSFILTAFIALSSVVHAKEIIALNGTVSFPPEDPRLNIYLDDTIVVTYDYGGDEAPLAMMCSYEPWVTLKNKKWKLGE